MVPASIRDLTYFKYAGEDNPNLESSVGNRIMDLVHLIEANHLPTEGTYKVIDWAHVVQYFTMDVLTNVAFSQPFGYLKKNTDLFDYINTVRTYIPVLDIPVVNTILSSAIVRMFMAPTAKDRIGMVKIMGIAKEIVGERFGPDTKVQNDMLGSFVRHGLTHAETESEVLLRMYEIQYALEIACYSSWAELLEQTRQRQQYAAFSITS